MLVHFNHYDRSCSAYIVGEPSPIKNTIIAYILDLNSELGYEVIFTKKEKNNWDTTAGIKVRHPLTYHDLCKKLSEVFPGDVFIGDWLNTAEINDSRSFIQ